MAVQVPPSLKAISPFLKTAQEYDKRDPVVAYYCKYNLKYFLDTKWYVVQKMFEKTATNDASYKIVMTSLVSSVVSCRRTSGIISERLFIKN